MSVTQPAEGTSPSPSSLFRNRDYMILWSGQFVSVLGTGVNSLTMPLLILFLTHSPAQAGLAGFLVSLPYVIFSLPAGALVDRWNRKLVMIVCDSGRFLVLGSIPLAAFLGHLTIVQLYIAAGVEGTLYTFFNIAEVAALPRVVPKDQLPSATAQNEAGQITSFLIGPPIGGFIFQVVGKTIPYLADSISYLASVISLLFIKTEFQQEREETGPQSLRREIVEGVSWLWHQPLIRFMAFLTGGLNFVSAGSGLLLIVLARQMHAPPAFIGVILSIGSIGGILGALIAPRIQTHFNFGPVIMVTVWFGALAFPLYDLAPNPLVLGFVMAASFTVGPIYNAVQFSYRLKLIPDELQGRVNSSFRLLAFGFQPIGLALSGLLIQVIGVREAILIYAAVGIGLAILTVLNAQVRNAPRLEPS